MFQAQIDLVQHLLYNLVIDLERGCYKCRKPWDIVG